MRKIFYCLMLSLVLVACQTTPDSSSIMKDMCRRLFPEQAGSFRFEQLDDGTEGDWFTLESVKGKILIQGNSTNSMAVGLNWYLKNYCHTRVSWYASDAVQMPDQLPVVPEKVRIESNCDHRFFLNYCTYGYSMPYWKWNDWERLIDWMALNGVNMPLALTGQESIWYKVWTSLGLSDEQVRTYFTGPAQLPWHRMSNVDYWQSPLPQSWLDHQEALQKQILERERALGMTPVLPAFAGHVPGELKEIYPEAKISTTSQWGGFDDQYKSHFINPSDSLYGVIQKLYIEEQTCIYGTDHIYGIDPFNEIDAPEWNEEFLSNVSKDIYESIHSVDPEAKWLQMTWMFYHSKEKWTPSRIKAFLESVPQDKLILLDYYCDFTEIWKETESYHGQPYMWCYLGNFGGNTFLAGDIDDVDAKMTNLFQNGGKNLYGVGVTLEALDANPLMYEYVFNKAWDEKKSPEQWVANWAECRGGNKDEHIVKAWQDLYGLVYNKVALCGQAVLINARPQLEGVQGWNTHPEYHYDNAALWQIWNEFLKAEKVDNDLYRFDVVNVGRQVLGNLFSDYRAEFTRCYHRKDLAGAEKWAGKMDRLIQDSDRLLSTSVEFNMGKWVKDARDFGQTEEEKRYYEENARGIVSVWGQKGTQLNDYANRGWAGLTGSFYYGRWHQFTQAVLDCMKAGKPFEQETYQKDIVEWEYRWTLQHEDFPVTSGEDPIAVAKELVARYAADFS